MINDQPLFSPRFPKASKYHPDWLAAGVSGGANSLWLAEWLTEKMEITPAMRVLDLGCGRGSSSVFLGKEFGMQVWSTDLWFSATERSLRFRDAGVESSVFPIYADARALPFANDFFDAIVSVDSFMYYGTDDLYLNYLARFLKPGGQIGIVGAGLVQEFANELPPHLKTWWEPSMVCLHSADWWRKHWERTGIVQVSTADSMPEGWKYWLDWQRFICPDNRTEIDAVEADKGRNIGYFRVVGRRRLEAQLDQLIATVPTEYSKQSLLRIDTNNLR